jgi:hypothetical protein
METSVNNKCKAFTSLEQSKKLAEILPLESADMFYTINFDYESKVISLRDVPLYIDIDGFVDTKMGEIHAWSLAALLDILPEGTRLLKSTNISSIGDTKYHCDCPKYNIDEWFDNSIDACYEMIIKLNELNLL